MSLDAAFFALDCIAIVAAVLLALALLATGPRNSATYLAAFVAATSACFYVFSRAIYGSSLPEAYRFVPGETAMLALQVLMNTAPGAFMLLAFRLFQEPGSRFPRAWLALFALQVGLEDLIPDLLGITTHPSTAPTMTDASPLLFAIFETLPAVLEAAFIAAALYWTINEWRADLVERRRQLRAASMFVIGVGIVSYTLLTRLILPPRYALMHYVHEGYMVLNVVGTLAILLGVLRASAAAAVEPRPVIDSTAREIDATAQLDFAAFDAAMKAHVYREAGLTVAMLAKRLGMPEYRLRRLINTRLGHRNFNQMLHAYRIAEASAALADPAQRRLPILTIALSVGYQSINPFNRAFRDLKGTTPSAFRQHALANAADGLGERNGATAP